MREYDPKKIEGKWQKKWATDGLYRTDDSSQKPKCYVLDEFPYPSGDGLHTGHTRIYTASDIYARLKRMQGYNVLHPSGWDAFGLPAEQYAIKNKVHPSLSVKKNTERYKEQMNRVGLSYDWEREINTTNPAFYKWTQWIFLRMLERGLAHESFEPINWCPTCQTGLANEDLDGGNCERCGTPVVKKPMRQWVLKITEYADRLIDDLDTLSEWPVAVKEAQRNWIGRSEGAEIDFPLDLPIFSGEIVFATNNEGKLKRMQKLFEKAGLRVTLKSPSDIGIKDFSVVEDGATIKVNAEKKARALGALTDLPILADDTGFFIAGTELDPVTVKRNALNGADESTMSVEEVGDMMLAYYQDIAKKGGGKIDAEWKNAFCFLTPDKVAAHVEAIRPVYLTDAPHGTADPHLPLRPLYMSKASGKYVLEQTEEEEMLEFAPIVESIRKLFTPSIKVFTTRPDTLFGATYLAISAELATKWLAVGWLKPSHGDGSPDHESGLGKADESVKAFISKTIEAEANRAVDEVPEKEGIFTGIYAENPANKEKIPVWIANYVLSGYGTGAIMAVPAHDERDYEFGKKYDLPIIKVIESEVEKDLWAGEGILVNSRKFDGMKSEDAKKAITEYVGGKLTKQYRLKDWVFSRQRYWGEPIPIVHCPKDGVVPVPDTELPVALPKVDSYQPTGTGESPLALIAEWVNTPCPKCGEPARRETNTMPQWAGSSWYYLRFMDPNNESTLIGKSAEKYWAPVDVYVGGAEHVTRHLIYARFWHKFLYDIGVVSTIEPFKMRRGVGLVLGEGGVKMSKRLGNVINPDDIVQRFGADTLRLYEMFMGPFGAAIAWSIDNLVGSRRFVERVWRMQEKLSKTAQVSSDTELLLHQTIKKTGEDIEGFSFNTVISQLMIFLNHLEKLDEIPEEVFSTFLLLLAPFAPHITEELWAELGHTDSIHSATWPSFDTAKLFSDTMIIAIQVNGKLRDTFEIARDTEEDAIKTAALERPNVKKWIGENLPKKVIYVKEKIVNIVL